MTRSAQREESFQRILNAASKRLRCEGLDGAAIAPVMADAGLTHGAFYAHFANKDELAVAAFRHALDQNRGRWVGNGIDPSWPDRLSRLGQRYLSAAHRDDLSASCAFGALASDAGRSSLDFRAAFEQELKKSLCAIQECPGLPEGDEQERAKDAIAFLALLVGGIGLSRAVADRNFSDQILSVCRDAAPRLAHIRNADAIPADGMAGEPLTIGAFPHRYTDHLRPSDAGPHGRIGDGAIALLFENARTGIPSTAPALADGGDSGFITTGLILDIRPPLARPGPVEIGTAMTSVETGGFHFRQAMFQEGRLTATAQGAVTPIASLNEPVQTDPLAFEGKP
ncbi:MAG: TetR family transcriptional regulator [Rhodospirillaceae bacterium]|nr:TetR family transcriptional regulator [Rhodospirillaceae bacterium]